MALTLWIDGDACPRPVKEMVVKAADRTGTPVILVANQAMRGIPSRQLQMVTVSRDFDSADNYIVQNLQAGDIVITADLPFADLVVSRQGWAINPRGEAYTEANIKERLAMRHLMEELRSGGSVSGGPPPYGPAEIKAFAAAFDRLLTARLKEG